MRLRTIRESDQRKYHDIIYVSDTTVVSTATIIFTFPVLNTLTSGGGGYLIWKILEMYIGYGKRSYVN